MGTKPKEACIKIMDILCRNRNRNSPHRRKYPSVNPVNWHGRGTGSATASPWKNRPIRYCTWSLGRYIMSSIHGAFSLSWHKNTTKGERGAVRPPVVCALYSEALSLLCVRGGQHLAVRVFCSTKGCKRLARVRAAEAGTARRA